MHIFHAHFAYHPQLKFPWQPAVFTPTGGWRGAGQLVGLAMRFNAPPELASKFDGTLEHVCEGNWERPSGPLRGQRPPCSSMSHPWATGATSFLFKHGLGLQPVEPGFAAWQAVPLLLDNQTMMSWVKGAVSTPHGPITVDLDFRSGAD